MSEVTRLTGTVSKMHTQLDSNGQPVSYRLPVGDEQLEMNDLVGRVLRLQYTGNIFCTHCGRKTKKSFNQGFCWPCFQKLACCDSCIMSPEKCHYEHGTCREPEWGEKFCMTDHIVYLANSSGLKVGITRISQVPTRWIDQGAVQAIPIFRVATRQLSGLVEDLLRQDINDRTNWRAMLKGQSADVDLAVERDRLFELFAPGIDLLQQEYGLQAVQQIYDAEPATIHYPVHSYPTKVVSFNLDKQPVAQGKLIGIKGQYLIFDTGVINIRKYTAYEMAVEIY
ncbi:DUF2797 domain-containing protein [Sansalvadorimonas sp. 2012CJ34-2]|uniref:DUF2797 domain-containing protein n=1 Tax=Parendozoicomonas callyspongiae TaxID=2942213 RepID=A0ABT0PL29_9GAMM|nr:DUF2797 domain-containing protein [Sansalvadorimonas sp. 2012CJ34-2]MCL6272095.1 DUF2797 domain-containing protein [Sansalvadorimonas sp. 2012CJ34-2]